MEQGSFWQSCYVGVPGNDASGYTTVRGALSHSEPSLEAVLDADDLCQELKSKDIALMGFFSNRRTLKGLISYATVLPPKDSSDARLYKHPFVATEVLCSDCPSLIELAVQPELLDVLWSFLSEPNHCAHVTLSAHLAHEPSTTTATTTVTQSPLPFPSATNFSVVYNKLECGSFGPIDREASVDSGSAVLPNSTDSSIRNSQNNNSIAIDIVRSPVIEHLNYQKVSDYSGSRQEDGTFSHPTQFTNCNDSNPYFDESFSHSGTVTSDKATQSESTVRWNEEKQVPFRFSADPPCKQCCKDSGGLDQFSSSAIQASQFTGSCNLNSDSTSRIESTSDVKINYTPGCNLNIDILDEATIAGQPSRLKPSRSSTDLLSLSSVFVDSFESSDEFRIQASKASDQPFSSLCPPYENPVLCGYFSKIVSAIYNNQGEKLATYLRSQPHLLITLLRLLHFPSIAEVIKLFLLTKSPEKAVFAPDRTLLTLLSQLSPNGPTRLYNICEGESAFSVKGDENGERQENISLILREVMHSECLFHPIYLATLTSRPACTYLMNCLASKSQPASIAAVEILSNLCFTATAFQDQFNASPEIQLSGAPTVSDLVIERGFEFEKDNIRLRLSTSPLPSFSEESLESSPPRETENSASLAEGILKVEKTADELKTVLNEQFPSSPEIELDCEALTSVLVEDHIIRVPLRHGTTLEHERESLDHLRESLTQTRARTASTESVEQQTENNAEGDEFCRKTLDSDHNVLDIKSDFEPSTSSKQLNNEMELFEGTVLPVHIVFDQNEELVLPIPDDLEKIAKGIFIEEFIIPKIAFLQSVLEVSADVMVGRGKRRRSRGRAGSSTTATGGNDSQEGELDSIADDTLVSSKYERSVDLRQPQREPIIEFFKSEVSTIDEEQSSNDGDLSQSGANEVPEDIELSCNAAIHTSTKPLNNCVDINDSCSFQQANDNDNNNTSFLSWNDLPSQTTGTLKVVANNCGIGSTDFDYTEGQALIGSTVDEPFNCNSQAQRNDESEHSYETERANRNVSELSLDTGFQNSVMKNDTDGSETTIVGIPNCQEISEAVIKIGALSTNPLSVLNYVNNERTPLDNRMNACVSTPPTFDGNCDSMTHNLSNRSSRRTSDSLQGSRNSTDVDASSSSTNINDKKQLKANNRLMLPNGSRPIVGFRCLYMLNFIKVLVRTTPHGLYSSRLTQISTLFTPEFLTTLVVLLFSHKWNNSLHISVAEIFQSIICLEFVKKQFCPSPLSNSAKSANFALFDQSPSLSLDAPTTTDVTIAIEKQDTSRFREQAENVLRSLLEDTPFLQELVRYFRKIRRVRLELNISSRREKRHRLLTGQTAHVLHLAQLLCSGQSQLPQDINEFLARTEEWSTIVTKELAVYFSALNDPLGGSIPATVNFDHERQKFVLPLGLGNASDMFTSPDDSPLSQQNFTAVVFNDNDSSELNEGTERRLVKNFRKRKVGRGRRSLHVEHQLRVNESTTSRLLRNGLGGNSFTLDDTNDPFSIVELDSDTRSSLNCSRESSYDNFFGSVTVDRSTADAKLGSRNHNNQKKRSPPSSMDLSNHFIFGDSFDFDNIDSDNNHDIEQDWAKFDIGEEIPFVSTHASNIDRSSSRATFDVSVSASELGSSPILFDSASKSPFSNEYPFKEEVLVASFDTSTSLSPENSQRQSIYEDLPGNTATLRSSIEQTPQNRPTSDTQKKTGQYQIDR